MTDLSDANVLFTAFHRAVKSARWKPTCQRAEHNALSLVAHLQSDIKNRTYHTAHTSSFLIAERGKLRLINGNTIRDRTLRHALCDEVLTPLLDRYLIYDNSASRVGKGVDFARRRLRCHLHKYYRKHGNQGYIMLIDFSRYYDNILHETALRQLTDLIGEEQILYLLDEIFESFIINGACLTDEQLQDVSKYKYNAVEYFRQFQNAEGYVPLHKSIPIGDQTSQVVGVYYPHRIDNYCKIVKGFKYYGRYMDDIYIIHQSKKELMDILKDIKAMADELGIFINDNKTQIYRIDRPFHFLQNSYYVTESGRVVERISKKRLKRMRQKLKKLASRVQNGEIPLEDIANMYRSWIGGYHKTMSKRQIRSLNNLYQELYGGLRNE